MARSERSRAKAQAEAIGLRWSIWENHPWEPLAVLLDAIEQEAPESVIQGLWPAWLHMHSHGDVHVITDKNLFYQITDDHSMYSTFIYSSNLAMKRGDKVIEHADWLGIQEGSEQGGDDVTLFWANLSEAKELIQLPDIATMLVEIDPNVGNEILASLRHGDDLLRSLSINRVGGLLGWDILCNDPLVVDRDKLMDRWLFRGVSPKPYIDPLWEWRVTRACFDDEGLRDRI